MDATWRIGVQETERTVRRVGSVAVISVRSHDLADRSQLPDLLVQVCEPGND